MDFNDHSALKGQHAFLSASKYHWINDDEQKFSARWTASRAAARGVQLHDFAHSAIQLGIKQARTKKTLNMYVNDGIGYKMSCEQILYFSENAYGTADTIVFRKNKLRIHDLKTGISQTSFRQIEVYAAYFCLEYSIDPYTIDMEFRIYQNDDIRVEEGDPDMISYIMDRIIELDQTIQILKEEEGIL